MYIAQSIQDVCCSHICSGPFLFDLVCICFLNNAHLFICSFVLFVLFTRISLQVNCFISCNYYILESKMHILC